mmetsp:Transcript_21023/g.44346  ORF Transcript_21023/g.44346 Transcript_21023/m.44346 type:complete len:237 (-) Transcript_21023:181-891(-)
MSTKPGAANEMSYSHNRRDQTATPLCGAHRPDAAKANPLLVKPQLGAVKGTTYDLPKDFQFTYGMKQERDGLSTGSVVENWVEHTGTKDKLPARDFTALNKAAVMAGNLDSKSVREYTKSHDIRVKVGGEKQKAPLPIDDDTTFGKCVRPSTPFDDILSHAHRYDWVMQSELAADVQEQRKATKPKSTKASEGHAKGNAKGNANSPATQKGFPDAPDANGLWKMKKFENVKPRVNQ